MGHVLRQEGWYSRYGSSLSIFQQIGVLYVRTGLLIVFALVLTVSSLQADPVWHARSDSSRFSPEHPDSCVEVIAETRNFPSLSVDFTHSRKDPLVIPEDPQGEYSLPAPGDPIDTIRYYVNRAHALYKTVTENELFTDYIMSDIVNDLPIGIRKTVGNTEFVIIIDSVVLTPTHAYLVAFMSLENPQDGRRLAFMGRGIGFSKEGGIVGNARLELLEDFSFELSENALIRFNGEGKSYVEWDCSGFQSLSVDADIEFSRDFLVPENPDGSIKEGRVTGNFAITVTDWRDMIARVSMEPFQVAGLEGVGFYVNDAVFDFSDVNNAPGVIFPDEYQSTLMTPENPQLWEGFFLKELSVKLPAEFKKKGNSARTEFLISNMLIDNMGFSGELAAKNLITREEGTMDGWAFSLDSIGIKFVSNSFTGAAIKGGINVPIFEKDTDLSYTAIINPGGEYLFNVTTNDEISIPLFQAGEVNIYPTSFIEIQIVDHEFRPRANLTGDMFITTSLSGNSDGEGSQLKLAEISFENLEIFSVAPYIQVKSFSLGSPALQQMMAAFPISIDNVGLKTIDGDVGLQFEIKVNLVGENSGAFAAEAGLAIMGTMDNTGGWQTWKFKYVDVSKIAIDIDGGAYKIKGSLVLFKRDAVYGDGFRGDVEAEFQPGIKVSAMALFGTVGGMRYWYADAMLTMPTGIVIYPGLAIYGFGGGAFHHMKQEGFADSPDDELGKASSGIVYKPDPDTFLGVKASINLGTNPSPESFNADITFEISFNNNGGVNTISLTGEGYFVTPALDVDVEALKEGCAALTTVIPEAEGYIEKLDDKGQIYARVNITMDIPNETLHGNLEVYVNVAGGILKGIQPNNRAGEAVLHFSPHEWYVRIGTPDNRIGLSLFDAVRADSYFMVGVDIPGSPPPPDNVSEILGGIDLDYMRDANALGNGSGFAFGSSFSVDTGDLSFLIFYGRFAAGVGFDVMLKNYGEDARCIGSSERLGINGWYANGQAYAYMQGKIGVKVNLPMYSGNFTILDIEAAVILQARLPNPVWMKGVVGGNYNILNGLIKGSCQFEVTIGEQCEIVGGSVLSGIKVIAETTPANSATGVNVFTAAQTVFNMPVNEQFEMVDIDDVKKVFRIQLQYFQLKVDGVAIPGVLEWNNDHTVVAFNPHDVLPAQKEITLHVKITFEEKVNGQWRAVSSNGRVVSEEVNTVFVSGDAPDYIPEENIVFSYPGINQFNYYKNEFNQGYIQLNRGQPELFVSSPNWDQKIRVSTLDGEVHEVHFTYSATDNKLAFNMPSGLRNDQVYRFDVVSIPSQPQARVDTNVQDVTSAVGDTGAEITTKDAEGSIDMLQDDFMFTTHFRTSLYNTFNDKISSLNFSLGARWPIETGIHILAVNITGSELFDSYEMGSVGDQNALIQFEADVNNAWYGNEVYPLVYAGYPVLPNTHISWREPLEALGLPPIKAIYIQQNDKLLTEAEIESDVAMPIQYGASIVYDLAFYSFYDYKELQTQACVASVNTSHPWISQIMTTSFPTIRKGTYRIKMRYVLPGRQTSNSERWFEMVNP